MRLIARPFLGAADGASSACALPVAVIVNESSIRNFASYEERTRTRTRPAARRRTGFSDGLCFSSETLKPDQLQGGFQCQGSGIAQRGHTTGGPSTLTGRPSLPSGNRRAGADSTASWLCSSSTPGVANTTGRLAKAAHGAPVLSERLSVDPRPCCPSLTTCAPVRSHRAGEERDTPLSSPHACGVEKNLHIRTQSHTHQPHDACGNPWPWIMSVSQLSQGVVLCSKVFFLPFSFSFFLPQRPEHWMGPGGNWHVTDVGEVDDIKSTGAGPPPLKQGFDDRQDGNDGKLGGQRPSTAALHRLERPWAACPVGARRPG